MQRVIPSRFVTGQEVAVDLSAAVGASPVDTTPLWLRAVAVIANTVAGTRDVMASTKK